MSDEIHRSEHIRQSTRLHWVTLGLLVISVGINFIDRGNLSVALSSIQGDLQLSAQQLGALSAAFFISYTLMQLIVGKLLDYFNVIHLYAVGYFVWSAATALTGLARGFHLFGLGISSFAIIFLLRLLLGSSESIAYPAYSKILTTLFPEDVRGVANSMIDAGTKVGPALGVMLGVFLIHKVAWRGMFLLLGTASMIWLLPWWFVSPHLQVVMDKTLETSPSYREIMSKRPFWGASIGHIGGNYTWSFFLTWLPYYFERERHYQNRHLALVSSLPFWCLAISTVAAGLTADTLIRRGLPAVRVRQSTVCIGVVGCSIFLFLAALSHGGRVFICLMVVSSCFLGLFSSNNWALAQSLSGSRAAAKWTSMQNFLANAAGALAAWLTGIIIGKTEHFLFAFAVTCSLLVFGAFFYWFVIGNTGPLEWPHQESSNCGLDSSVAKSST